ncbi:MAG: hypothetical protein ORN58_07150, partial [Sediminibacterium sp.]|nr:hypothetical protein [Sediminibacterium sp.]
TLDTVYANLTLKLPIIFKDTIYSIQVKLSTAFGSDTTTLYIKPSNKIIYISTINQLDSIGKYFKYPLTASYNLTRSLDFKDNNSYSDTSIKNRLITGTGFIPIGINGNNINSFSGEFFGNGFEIKNLYINRSGVYKGLFANLSKALISNLGLTMVNIKTNFGNYIGALAGNASYSNISNCYSTGIININDSAEIAKYYIGGLIGYLSDASITNSFSLTKIISNSSNNNQVGGLIGAANNTKINNAYSRYNISGSFNYSTTAGLIGTSNGNNTIKNCYAIANINKANQNLSTYNFVNNNQSTDSFYNNYTDNYYFSWGTINGRFNVTNYNGFTPDSLLGNSNQFKFEKGKYPYLYKLNTNILLDSQSNYNEGPSGLKYYFSNIMVDTIIVFQNKKTTSTPGYFRGSAPFNSTKFNVIKVSDSLQYSLLDSVYGSLTISLPTIFKDTIYSIQVKLSTAFGSDTTTLYIKPSNKIIYISTINQLDSVGKYDKYPLIAAYSLTRSLDFNDNNSYSDTTNFKGRLTKGVGFIPIGFKINNGII